MVQGSALHVADISRSISWFEGSVTKKPRGSMELIKLGSKVPGIRSLWGAAVELYFHVTYWLGSLAVKAAF